MGYGLDAELEADDLDELLDRLNRMAGTARRDYAALMGAPDVTAGQIARALSHGEHGESVIP